MHRALRTTVDVKFGERLTLTFLTPTVTEKRAAIDLWEADATVQKVREWLLTMLCAYSLKDEDGDAVCLEGDWKEEIVEAGYLDHPEDLLLIFQEVAFRRRCSLPAIDPTRRNGLPLGSETESTSAIPVLVAG